MNWFEQLGKGKGYIPHLMKPVGEMALASIAICVLIAPLGVIAQPVSDQAEQKSEDALSTNSIFKPLEFQKCLPAWLEARHGTEGAA